MLTVPKLPNVTGTAEVAPTVFKVRLATSAVPVVSAIKGVKAVGKRRTEEEQAAINAAAKEILGDGYKPTKEAQALSNPSNSAGSANSANGTAFDQFLGTLSDVGEIMRDSPVTISNYGAFVEGLADLLRVDDIDWSAVENYMVAATPPASTEPVV